MAKFNDNAIIKNIIANPKKPGCISHGIYEKYRDGMTVREALSAGIRRIDLINDTERGFIEIGEMVWKRIS